MLAPKFCPWMLVPLPRRYTVIAVGTVITDRPPGAGRRSPAPRSHRTRRADFPHRALRQLVHSTASACSSRYGRGGLGCSSGVLVLIWLKVSFDGEVFRATASYGVTKERKEF